MQSAMEGAPACYERCGAALSRGYRRCDDCIYYNATVETAAIMRNLYDVQQLNGAVGIREEEVRNVRLGPVRLARVQFGLDDTNRAEERRNREEVERNKKIEEKRKKIANAVQANQMRFDDFFIIIIIF